MSKLTSCKVVSVVAMSIVFVMGCDQLNKPMPPMHLRSTPPSTGVADAGDAGHSLAAEAGAPAPSITAQPGDIHL